MRRIQEIEIELPQIVLERADAAYAQIRQCRKRAGLPVSAGTDADRGRFTINFWTEEAGKTGRPRAGDSHGQQASYWR